MAPPLKVLFINHSVRDGGPGRSLFYLAKYLDRKKIRPLILMPKEGVITELLKKEGFGEDIIIDGRFTENILTPRYNSNRGFYKIASFLWNILDVTFFVLKTPFMAREKGVDIIYCNGTLAKITGAFIGTFSHKPVIWHVRNIQEKEPLRFTIKALSMLPAVKKIICVSYAAARQFQLARDKVGIVYNGVDMEEFSPENTKGVLRREYGIGEDTVIVGNVGRIVPRKNYGKLIWVARTVKERLSEEEIKKIKFVVVGDTPHYFSNHLAKLKELVKGLEVEDLFVFTGFRFDVKPYLRDFDVFAIPSSYSDPFPRSVIEAMAFSLPVVGFRIGGIAEAVEDRVTGILSEPGNTNSMADAILKLIRDKSLRESFGQAARRRAEKLFDVKAKTKEVEEKILETALT